jgi:urease accessory protein
MNAQLHIQVAARNKCSYLKEAFFTTPLKVMNITEDKKCNPLHLMLMSSSPGILDGDKYEISIEVEKSASLQLHTQAYQRLFNMKQEAAQQMKVLLQEGASFCYVPHPSVPHQQSNFTACNYFYLSDYCRFIFGEVLTCGRKLNGEIFLFNKYHSITHVYLNNRLMIKENLLMQPALVNVDVIGQLEGYTHQASLIYLQQNVDMKPIQELLLQYLSTQKEVEGGISAAPINGLIVRLLGNGAEQLFDCLKQIQRFL